MVLQCLLFQTYCLTNSIQASKCTELFQSQHRAPSSQFLPRVLAHLVTAQQFQPQSFLSVVKNPAGLLSDFRRGLVAFIYLQHLPHLFCSLKRLQPFLSTEMLHSPHSSMSQGSAYDCAISSCRHLAAAQTLLSPSSNKHASLTLPKIQQQITQFPNKTSLPGLPCRPDGRHNSLSHLA